MHQQAAICPRPSAQEKKKRHSMQKIKKKEKINKKKKDIVTGRSTPIPSTPPPHPTNTHRTVPRGDWPHPVPQSCGSDHIKSHIGPADGTSIVLYICVHVLYICVQVHAGSAGPSESSKISNNSQLSTSRRRASRHSYTPEPRRRSYTPEPRGRWLRMLPSIASGVRVGQVS